MNIIDKYNGNDLYDNFSFIFEQHTECSNINRDGALYLVGEDIDIMITTDEKEIKFYKELFKK